MAFILGTPANEIVIPIMLMTYMCTGALTEMGSGDALRQILLGNGWTVKTAVCMLTFTVFHWPCATTLMTIKKETASFKLTVISAILPTMFGIILCSVLNIIF